MANEHVAGEASKSERAPPRAIQAKHEPEPTAHGPHRAVPQSIPLLSNAHPAHTSRRRDHRAQHARAAARHQQTRARVLSRQAHQVEQQPADSFGMAAVDGRVSRGEQGTRARVVQLRALASHALRILVRLRRLLSQSPRSRARLLDALLFSSRSQLVLEAPPYQLQLRREQIGEFRWVR